MITTDADRRQACLILAAVYPTRREQALTWVAAVACRWERTIPVGDIADQWRAQSQRRRGEQAHQGGRLPDRRRWTR